MTNHGFGVKGDDQILREENRPVSLFIAITEKMKKEERKAVSKTSYRYGKRLILSLYQTYKVEERKYQDKPLDFINKFCLFRYEHN